MAEALYSASDYAAALLALLPTGRVWPKDGASEQAALMRAFAETFVRLDARAQTLLIDAFPGTTLELLPDWEASLGLPDPCEGAAQTLQQRRYQVIARLAGAAGQSVAYFLGVLSRLGYTDAAIHQFAPFRADASSADTPVYGEDWWTVWEVVIPDLRVFYFCADISAADEALVTISNDVLICVLEALKPAHTTILYAKPGTLDFSDPDQSGLLPGL